jgi:hypothetical protein
VDTQAVEPSRAHKTTVTIGNEREVIESILLRLRSVASDRGAASNVPVERHAVASSRPKLIDPDSSIPSDDQKRRGRVSAPT